MFEVISSALQFLLSSLDFAGTFREKHRRKELGRNLTELHSLLEHIIKNGYGLIGDLNILVKGTR